MDFVKRPVAIFSLSFYISFCFFAVHTDHISLPLCIFLFLSAAVLSLLGLRVFKGKSGVMLRSLAILFAALFVSLCYAGYSFKYGIEKYSYLYGKEVTIGASVTDVCFKGEDYGSYIINVTSENGSDVDYTACLSVPSTLKEGDVITSKAIGSEILEAEGFNERQYYLSKGACISFSADKIIPERRDFSSLKVKGAIYNSAISKTITKNLSEDSAGFAKAVLLGNKEDLDRSDTRNLSRLGISHLIAVSGMHVSLIYAAVVFFAGKLSIGKKQSCVIGMAIVLLFMVITGFSGSVTRAALLCCLISLLTIIGISHDSVTSVGLCACVIIMVKPSFALDVGLQLSLSAYLGCIAVSTIAKRHMTQKESKSTLKNKLLRWLSLSFLTSCIISIFTLPISILYFDTFSLIGPFANLLFIPLFNLTLYLNIFLLILSPVTPVFEFVSFLTDKYMSFIIFIIEKVSSLDNITLSLNYSFAPPLIFIASASLIAIAVNKNKRLQKACSAALSLSVLLFGAGAVIHAIALKDDTTVFRVGGRYGAAYTVISGTEALICDYSFEQTSYTLYAQGKANEMCITDPTALLISRYTDSSVKGAVELAKMYKLDYAYFSYPDPGEEELYIDAASALSKEGVKVIKLENKTETFMFGKARITVYSENDSNKTGTFSVAAGDSRVVCLSPENGDEFDIRGLSKSVKNDCLNSAVIVGCGTFPTDIGNAIGSLGAEEVYLFDENSADFSKIPSVRAFPSHRTIEYTLD